MRDFDVLVRSTVTLGWCLKVADLSNWVQLLWQEQKFKLWVLQAPAEQFESIFTRVMRASSGDSFHVARPGGAVGDFKCDGWDSRTKTLYAVYAPFSRKSRSAIRAKVRSDFSGALEKWPEMRQWRMVHNDFFGLSAELTRELEILRGESEGLGVEILPDWDPQELWQIVRKLPGDVCFELLGGPDFSVAMNSDTLNVVPLRYHEDLHPAVTRAAVASVSSLCGNFQPDGLVDPLCASAFARAVTSWWLNDEELFWQYVDFLRDRCDATPFEAQLTAMLFLMCSVEICARKLDVSVQDLLLSQIEADSRGAGEKLLMQITLEQMQGGGGGFYIDDARLRKKFVEGCGQLVIDFLGMVAVGVGFPAILILQDLLVSLQRLDYNDGILT
ncbi:hypothetical protein [Streptomyces sp. NPDC057554]|uniref:hypothetical protein n=1 Tax=Streptomyces sp. NPDC057554 TaxID=3350538 RepID=UPI0036AD1BC6